MQYIWYSNFGLDFHGPDFLNFSCVFSDCNNHIFFFGNCGAAIQKVINKNRTGLHDITRAFVLTLWCVAAVRVV
jgi:hypothetical protein